MPSDRINHILHAIDAGLQSPDPTVVAITPAPRPTTCWRCSTHKTARESGLCEGCRAWCAAECDEDPANRVHARVEMPNKLGDVPETRPKIDGPHRAGCAANEASATAVGGMWGRLFAPVGGVT